MKLTLLPMLASAAVAAQPASPAAVAALGVPGEVSAPGATEPMLSPPGLTPTIDECRADPDDERCPPVEDEEGEAVAVSGYRGYVYAGHGWIHHRVHRVHRGGFGHYFGVSGG